MVPAMFGSWSDGPRSGTDTSGIIWLTFLRLVLLCCTTDRSGTGDSGVVLLTFSHVVL